MAIFFYKRNIFLKQSLFCLTAKDSNSSILILRADTNPMVQDFGLKRIYVGLFHYRLDFITFATLYEPTP